MTQPASVPSQMEIQAVADRLRDEFEPRFRARNIDLSIGRMRWLVTRGIGFELNGEWDSIHVAQWSLRNRGWVALTDIAGLEAKVRDYFERELASRST